MVEMNVVVGHWQAAFATDLVFAFEHTELRRTRDCATDVSQLSSLGERFSDVKHRADMAEYPATTRIVLICEWEFFDEWAVGTVLDFPARLAHRFDTPLGVDLVEPLGEHIWLGSFFGHLGIGLAA